jgi:hypothetical protein
MCGLYSVLSTKYMTKLRIMSDMITVRRTQPGYSLSYRWGPWAGFITIESRQRGSGRQDERGERPGRKTSDATCVTDAQSSLCPTMPGACACNCGCNCGCGCVCGRGWMFVNFGWNLVCTNINTSHMGALGASIARTYVHSN